MHTLLVARLQITVPAALLAKADQRLLVMLSEQIQMAENQSDIVIAGRHLDLGNAALAIQRADQRRQIRQRFTERWYQYRTSINRGNEMVALFPKADQHLFTGFDIFDAKTRLTAIAGHRPTQGLQPALRLKATEMLQLLLQHHLFETHLLVAVEVLQAATTATIRMGAGRRLPMSGSDPHFDGAAFIKLTVQHGVLAEHRLARQSGINKGGFAIRPGNATAVVTERLHHQLLRRRQRFAAGHQTPSGQAARNSSKCGCFSCFSQSRSNAVSFS